ncbi:Endoribonuclease L-PSP [Spironucleus salmonicida]|uniref:Endoribonuclease L-PSP n=1 Tax=Spironucleus salmonicida TaxID=348837 RepID=V6LZH9_9EUKA|nr:Endoribonuclease L-PSP [Spironucleus salmonicida]|eukprot:EST49156.1 Endoribonuclease L-PSP [Spironucleus salmonicida]
MGCGATNSLDNKKPLAKSFDCMVVNKSDKFLNISCITGSGSTIEAQTDSVMKKLLKELTKHNMKATNVVKLECLLSDLQNFAKFNEIYGAALDGWKPARLCVQDNLASGILVQLNCIATD